MGRELLYDWGIICIHMNGLGGPGLGTKQNGYWIALHARCNIVAGVTLVWSYAVEGW